ncbi:MAG TPA: aldo/keto reductase [Thermoanaerobaculia bacterium]|nr:aldo/keto reductase [Thermoanaerobaculia bacterium]
MTALTDYRTLGKTGLKVSPLGLGVMTFGWGADEAAARAIFERYVEGGGNFIDTADMYSNGASEDWLGKLVRDANARDRLVIATKFTFNPQQGNPNSGGNGRKNILRAIDGSLRRLQTDYIDLYVMHTWDRATPVDEVLSTLNDLVRAGKIRHIGLSDVPAWWAARAWTIADLRGWEKPATLQLEYSLLSRSLEREHALVAQELGISITPWSPLAGGFLSGKYQRSGNSVEGGGRVSELKDSGNPIFERFAKREENWRVLDVVREVAAEAGRTPSEVALRWVISRPGVTSTLIGATKLAQLESNLAALELVLSPDQLARLDAVSALEPTELDHFFGTFFQSMVNGGTTVARTYY